MALDDAVRRGRQLRAIGFDDAPFLRGSDEPVPIAGVVCSDTKFEGMVWGDVTPDGFDATQRIIDLLADSKFLSQLHVVLIDGIAFGGFNIVDLPALASELGVPCVAVMRQRPDLKSVHAALERLDEPERRMELLARAGEIHDAESVCFQVAGAAAETVARAMPRLIYTGHVPEPLRMAHLIGAAVVRGESGRRA
ncbi:MAG: DUF99 family protein [Myxococcota bacterium]